jgi:TonB family protein
VSSKLIRWLAIGWFAMLLGTLAYRPVPAFAEDALTRKVKTKVAAVYPDLARRMAIAGTVKVAVVVTQSGAVKSTKIVGGHPLLVDAAVDAVKKWKFEPASEESTGVVEFKFQPDN